MNHRKLGWLSQELASDEREHKGLVMKEITRARIVNISFQRSLF